MKKLFSLVAVAAVSVLLAAQAHAQLGVVAGLTSSKADAQSAIEDAGNISLYHAGLTYRIGLGAGFALQPSVLYQVKGAHLGSLDTAKEDDFKLKTGYVEVPVAIQWGPEVPYFRPYVFAEPFLGYQITSSDKGNAGFSGWTEQAKSKFEYGFGLGGGIELASHVQLSVQWFKNLGTMFGEDVRSGDETWNTVKDMKNFQGIKVTLGILF